MQGTMMNYPLTLVHLLERAGKVFPQGEIVSRLPDQAGDGLCIAVPMRTSTAGHALWPARFRRRACSGETGWRL